MFGIYCCKNEKAFFKKIVRVKTKQNKFKNKKKGQESEEKNPRYFCILGGFSSHFNLWKIVSK